MAVAYALTQPQRGPADITAMLLYLSLLAHHGLNITTLLDELACLLWLAVPPASA